MKTYRNFTLRIFSKKPCYKHLKDYKEEVLINGKLVLRPMTIPMIEPGERWWYLGLLINGKMVQKWLLDFRAWSLEEYKLQWKLLAYGGGQPQYFSAPGWKDRDERIWSNGGIHDWVRPADEQCFDQLEPVAR